MNETALQPAIDELAKSGWSYANKKLSKKFTFKNFNDAFAFMTRCSLSIAKRDHHPEWFNVYNKVNIDLTTYDAGDVTVKDIELAQLMDKIAAKFIA